MLSKFIKPGDRVELQTMDQINEYKEDDKKIYYSKINEIISDNQVEINMPLEKTRLLLLSVGEEYNFVIFTDTGLFQCFTIVEERYKTNNLFLLRLKLTSNLRKYQRREYYRFGCAMEMQSRIISEAELRSINADDQDKLKKDLPLKSSVIVDISGGGIRFVSEEAYPAESKIYINYDLIMKGERKNYELIGKILSASEMDNRPGTYEHRVKYINIDSDTREEIIKYIFEEERKIRQKERSIKEEQS